MLLPDAQEGSTQDSTHRTLSSAAVVQMLSKCEVMELKESEWLLPIDEEVRIIYIFYFVFLFFWFVFFFVFFSCFFVEYANCLTCLLLSSFIRSFFVFLFFVILFFFVIFVFDIFVIVHFFFI